jgi:hypothetical protein
MIGMTGDMVRAADVITSNISDTIFSKKRKNIDGTCFWMYG